MYAQLCSRNHCSRKKLLQWRNINTLIYMHTKKTLVVAAVLFITLKRNVIFCSSSNHIDIFASHNFQKISSNQLFQTVYEHVTVISRFQKMKLSTFEINCDNLIMNKTAKCKFLFKLNCLKMQCVVRFLSSYLPISDEKHSFKTFEVK